MCDGTCFFFLIFFWVLLLSLFRLDAIIIRFTSSVRRMNSFSLQQTRINKSWPDYVFGKNSSKIYYINGRDANLSMRFRRNRCFDNREGMVGGWGLVTSF